MEWTWWAADTCVVRKPTAESVPMLSTEKEFERYIGVVFKRDDEKLGMTHWQHSQVALLWV